MNDLVDALVPRARYRRVTNLGVGMAIALLIAGAATWKLDAWDVIRIGIIAGLYGPSVEAAKAHETPQAPATKPTAQGGAGAGGQPLRDNAHGPV